MSKRRVYFLGISIVFLCVLFSCSSEYPKDEFLKETQISLRGIGDQLLLANGDSTSLVLPIKKISEFTYELSFEKTIAISPDTLVQIMKSGFRRDTFFENYVVEVIQCKDGEVAYSYQIRSDTEKTIIPCSGRALPLSCYTIQIEFLQSEKRGFLVISLFGILILLSLIIYALKKKKATKKSEGHTYIGIGSFRFYPEQNKLIREAIEINLSKKECEILEIFISQPNQIIRREDLTKKVWEDNGVFVGRSLDTYISKLRKKLQEDNSIQIKNVHGVGYKLEM